jgi:hypothetical protein
MRRMSDPAELITAGKRHAIGSCTRPDRSELVDRVANCLVWRLAARLAVQFMRSRCPVMAVTRSSPGLR